MDAAAGGNLDEALVHLLEEQIDIAGADFAVAAEIRILLVGDLGADAGDVVQQSLTVVLGDLSVAVKVAVGQIFGSGRFDLLAVRDSRYIGGQVCGILGFQHGFVCIGVRGIRVGRQLGELHVLRKEVSVQIEVGGRIPHVI